MTKSSLKRILALAAAAIVLLSLLPGALSTPAAADGARDVANTVVMVRFAGDAQDVFAANWSALRDMYNKTDGRETASLKRYLSIVSDGRLNVVNYFPQEQGGTVAALTLPAGVTAASDDSVIIGAVIDAYRGQNAAVRLDNSESGVLDNLTVLIQGSADGTGDTLYPHKSVYGGSEPLFGSLVRSYNFINSDVLFNDTLMRQGVICHEFLHSLGLPDLYRYSLNDGGQPVGRWDLMASASVFMQYPLAYSRSQLGWLTMDTITQPGTYTLDWVGTSGGTRGFKIATPLSGSEFFALEYRVKPEQSSANIQNPPLDFKIPASGMLIYRVDPQVPGNTNSQGLNYIYVFRPDVTDKDAATENNNRATVQPVSGETAYGSADLAAPFTDNTIYYSDGSNSGITISNVALVDGGAKLRFDVAFADYSALDLWDVEGAAIGADASSPSVAMDGATIYAAYNESGVTVVLRQLGDGTWERLAAAPNLFEPQLMFRDGALYLLGASYVGGSHVYCRRLSGGAWQEVYSLDLPDGSYPDRVRFVSSAAGLYASFNVGNTLNIIDLFAASAVSASALPGGNIANPSVCVKDGVFYAAYTDGGTASRVARLDGEDWASVLDMDAGLNTFSLQTDGARVALAASGNFTTPKYYSFDGASWTAQELTALANATEVQLVLARGTPYIGCILDGAAKVFQPDGGGWGQLGANVSASVFSLSLAQGGGKLCAATVKDVSFALDVSSYTLGSEPLPPPTPVPPDPVVTPTPTPVVTPTPTPIVTPTPTPIVTPTPTPVVTPTTDDYSVTVTPPSGYSDTALWIDGAARQATASGGALSVQLADGSAKTVTMYRYNERGVPIGMYVWTLSYQNGAYTVTPVPELADLLSYHGFSIRVEGVAGIRFKTGISATLRATLLSDGVDGYTLKEYGTLFTNNANLASLPFVRGGDKIGSGRAYWRTASGVNDYIFETVQGRHRFTSVITEVPAAYYRTEFAFRGYIILEKGGAETVFYGPVVSRSIYTVAQQVLTAGEFAAGSAGDRYVRGLISSAG